jgi:hypothetical protein
MMFGESAQADCRVRGLRPQHQRGATSSTSTGVFFSTEAVGFRPCRKAPRPATARRGAGHIYLARRQISSVAAKSELDDNAFGLVHPRSSPTTNLIVPACAVPPQFGSKACSMLAIPVSDPARASLKDSLLAP